MRQYTVMLQYIGEKWMLNMPCFWQPVFNVICIPKPSECDEMKSPFWNRYSRLYVDFIYSIQMSEPTKEIVNCVNY